MARNKSNNSQYIKTDINYDKLAEAIVNTKELKILKKKRHKEEKRKREKIGSKQLVAKK